ncbi:hypothetical protein IAD21_06333 [Abditibacteriota bacterium]|nr:hypothetical protein IAD21_06333 [Abditibacteriota bacterium]
MGAGLTSFDCNTHTTREINSWLRQHSDASVLGETLSVVLLNPDSRHNLGVGLVKPLKILIEGPVGYYCAGLCDGIEVEIAGGAGWGLAENLMGGKVVLHGSAGSAAGATMRGGLVVIHGDAGARCGVAMKGGTLLVTGDVGVMSSFMMQKGALIIGGDADHALGDSLYEGKIYLRGEAASLGADARIAELNANDVAFLSGTFLQAGVDFSPDDFKKVESARRLYNFDTKEKEIWKQAL